MLIPCEIIMAPVYFSFPYFYVLIRHCVSSCVKVGDQDEKLAEGIKLYAIPLTATSKRTILSDLITVC